MSQLADELADKHGDQVGIECLGYPTRMCHTRWEIDQIRAHLLKGE
jgi:hypothetical protein